jgi:hypothetical protein
MQTVQNTEGQLLFFLYLYHPVLFLIPSFLKSDDLFIVLFRCQLVISPSVISFRPIFPSLLVSLSTSFNVLFLRLLLLPSYFIIISISCLFIMYVPSVFSYFLILYSFIVISSLFLILRILF